MTIFDVPLEQLRQRNTIKWRRFESDVLPLFVAEMDAMLADPVRECLIKAARDGDTGYPELPVYQEAFAAYAAQRWGWQTHPGEMTLAADVMSGMREVLLGNTAPGDVVVFSSPAYPPFRQIVETTGRVLVDVPLSADRLDLAALEETFAQRRPSAYLLCSPHNPNGTVHTLAELTRLAELAQRHGVLVISDEVHAPLTGQHIAYLSVPGVTRAVVVTSAAKGWHLAGLKAGLIIGDAQVRAKVNPMISDGASYLGVLAHATALNEAAQFATQVGEEIAAHKVFFAQQLASAIPQLSYQPSAGTYLAWLDCTPLGLSNPGHHFHQHGRVRFNFGAEFAPYAQQYVRINLATSPKIIAEAVQRMANSLTK